MELNLQPLLLQECALEPVWSAVQTCRCGQGCDAGGGLTCTLQAAWVKFRLDYSADRAFATNSNVSYDAVCKDLRSGTAVAAYEVAVTTAGSAGRRQR
jgi:hypothetical protein